MCARIITTVSCYTRKILGTSNIFLLNFNRFLSRVCVCVCVFFFRTFSLALSLISTHAIFRWKGVRFELYSLSFVERFMVWFGLDAAFHIVCFVYFFFCWLLLKFSKRKFKTSSATVYLTLACMQMRPPYCNLYIRFANCFCRCRL